MILNIAIPEPETTFLPMDFVEYVERTEEKARIELLSKPFRVQLYNSTLSRATHCLPTIAYLNPSFWLQSHRHDYTCLVTRDSHLDFGKVITPPNGGVRGLTFSLEPSKYCCSKTKILLNDKN